MIILGSIVLIIIIYYCLKWLYNEYRKDLDDLDKHNIHMQKKISEVEKSNMANLQMIQWLYDELTKKKLIDDIKKERGEKNEKRN